MRAPAPGGADPRVGPFAPGPFALGLLWLTIACGGACRNAPPHAPVEHSASACCEVVSADLKRGAGCRVATRCHRDEPVWMRGAVVCSPVETERCRGGRCCHYRPAHGDPEAAHHWDEDPGADVAAP